MIPGVGRSSVSGLAYPQGVVDVETDVAPDGSPVAVYLALPVEPEFTPVLHDLAAPATVLDLGCGVGRLANELARRGHAVTGVDESAAMLRHLHAGVDAVESRIERLNLGQRFDVVVLASNMVNVADHSLRRSFLECTARHVTSDGQVFIEHYDPDRMLEAQESGALVGEVRVVFKLGERRGEQFDGVVTYHVGESSWSQAFTGEVLDDDGLDAELASVGLRRMRRLSPVWLAAGRVRDATGRGNGG